MTDANRSDRSRRLIRHPRSIGAQLLITVNLVMGAGLVFFLITDYRQSVEQRISEKRTALIEEAKTMASSVHSIVESGGERLQGYIDAVCARMNESSSPGHHIAVRVGNEVTQARSHQRASPSFLAAMEDGANAPKGRSTVDGKPIVVATDRDGDVIVYISEYTSDILRTVRSELMWRMVTIAALGVLGTLLVNLILARLVTRPLKRLVNMVRQIGHGSLQIRAADFNSAEFSWLAEEINAMSRALASAQQEQTYQLRKARRIQEHLNPHEVCIPGLTAAYLYEPATMVAGDFYDVFPLIDNTFLVCLGDISGHGIPAAMGAAMLKTLFATQTAAISEPAQLLEAVNARFREVMLPGDFASLFLVRWDPSTLKITYASAGHETCYWVGSDGALSPLQSTGTLLGVDNTARWEQRDIRLSAGDKVVMLTDGVTEAMGPDQTFFGRKSTVRFIEDHHGDAPDVLVRRLSQQLAAHHAGAPPRDDITTLVLEVEGSHSSVSSGAGRRTALGSAS